MMTANAQAFVIVLWLLGLLAWIALILGFSIVALVRKVVAWIGQWT